MQGKDTTVEESQCRTLAWALDKIQDAMQPKPAKREEGGDA